MMMNVGHRRSIRLLKRIAEGKEKLQTIVERRAKAEHEEKKREKNIAN